MIAFHPFRHVGISELRLMTWNVHCSGGTEEARQKKIAELIMNEDADFVLLSEYNQDSCRVIDSLLKTRYRYTEEYQSHKYCGDIFYSKRMLSNSGHVHIPIQGKGIQTIMATLKVSRDSIQIFGVHMASNRFDESTNENNLFNGSSPFVRYKNTQKLRNFQAYWTKESVLKSSHPVIVMGDMNDFNSSPPLDTLTSCGLKDSWWEGGNGYGSTFHSGWMRLRIDHILHSKELKLERVKVIDTDLSDHNPVVAGFSISK